MSSAAPESPEAAQIATVTALIPDLEAATARLGSAWIKIARPAWILLCVLALGFILTSIPGYLTALQQGFGHGEIGEITTGRMVLNAISLIASLAAGVLSFSLAALFFLRRFEERIIAALSFYLLLYSVIMSGVLEFWAFYWIEDQGFVYVLQSGLMAFPTIALLALFPDGHFVPTWMRWVVLASLPWNLATFFVPPSSNWQGASGALLIVVAILGAVFLSLGIYAQIHRYRRVSTPEQRRQTKWVLYGFSVFFVYIFVSSVPYYYLSSLPPGTPAPWWEPVTSLGWWLSLNIVPLSLAIALARSRLWNIDVVINRSLVYGTLTVLILGVYMLLVTGLGALLGMASSSLAAVIATAAAALAFNPLRQALQNTVNRMMFGERDNPLAVLARMGERLESTGSPEAALRSIVETVARAFRLSYAAIHLDGDETAMVSYGLPTTTSYPIAMTYQGETVGRLIVSGRSRGEALTPKDLEVLETIARQAGAAAQTLKLTHDLQQARVELVGAREEERRRIRRDLHDGLGPQLASQKLSLEAIERLIDDDPQAARELIKVLKTQSTNAIEDIRGLIYNLRPPALDDLGLVYALRESFERYPKDAPQISIQSNELEPGLPAAVELAAYRIIQEAVNNVVRHSGAKHCDVRLVLAPRELRIRVIDDGQGLPEALHKGVGIRSMHERVDELGGRIAFDSQPNGGTRLSAYLPLHGDAPAAWPGQVGKHNPRRKYGR